MLAIEGGDRGGGGRVIASIDGSRAQTGADERLLELADVLALVPWPEVAIHRNHALEHEHRPARDCQRDRAIAKARTAFRRPRDDGRGRLQARGGKHDRLRRTEPHRPAADDLARERPALDRRADQRRRGRSSVRGDLRRRANLAPRGPAHCRKDHDAGQRRGGDADVARRAGSAFELHLAPRYERRMRLP